MIEVTSKKGVKKFKPKMVAEYKRHMFPELTEQTKWHRINKHQEKQNKNKVIHENYIKWNTVVENYVYFCWKLSYMEIKVVSL